MAHVDHKPPSAEPRASHGADWSLLLAVIGVVAGTALGSLAFWGLLKYGFYAIMLPGALAGLGGGFPLRRRVVGLGVFAAIVSIPATILTEWWNLPFANDESLGFFLTHLHHLKPPTLLMMALGVAAAFWFGMGRETT